MSSANWIDRESLKSLERILPRIQNQFQINVNSEDWHIFETRLKKNWKQLFRLFIELYGGYYDFFYHLEMLIISAAQSWLERADELKILDKKREQEPDWFISNKEVGGVLYVDLFSDNLSKLHEHIDYLKNLGLTYLHIMPVFVVPKGNNDGGYAVSNYRMINPEIGTMEELKELASILRQNGISVVLDFVLNHTSDEHEWAVKAQAGDEEYQSYYHIFEDRTLPDQYQQTLRDIFPTVRKGSFTWHEGMQKWVWTTFNSFQWDINYSNPSVFRAMAEEMLFLANTGIEILRLDAVPFMWKRMGTNCENQPEVHTILQAFNAVARIAAPSLLFKSEAIVHPNEVIKYISSQECQLSYNPMLMALLWEALATRQIRLLAHAMNKRNRTPKNCTWVNYLRCHDDIGWTFDDQDALELGINPKDHRKFLNDFYTGEFPGSFARGVPFQFNPETGDLRVAGTLASLAGLEQAIHSKNSLLIDMAIRRISMLFSTILSIGGIPLIYLGEEWGLLNDYGYINDIKKSKDSR